jgi:ABC-type multidrug transport system fused ATPase/permease subunit
MDIESGVKPAGNGSFMIENLKKMKSVFRLLFPYFRRFKRDLIRSIFLVSLLTAIRLGRPVILALVIDNAVKQQDFQQVLFYSCLFFFMLSTGVFAGYYQIRLMARFGLRIVNQLKRDLFEHVLSLDMSFFNKHKTGWLLSRVESDAEQLKQFCSQVTVRMFVDYISMIGIFVVMFRVDSSIAYYLSAVLLLTVLVALSFISFVKKFHEQVRVQHANVSAYLSEYLQGMDLIRLFNRQNQVDKKLHQVALGKKQARIRAGAWQWGFWSVLVFSTETLMIALILYFGLHKVGTGTMSLGQLVMFVEYAHMIAWPLQSFSENLNQLQRAFVSGERVLNIFSQRSKITRGQALYDKLEIETIEFDSVDFSYLPEKKVLHSVNFKVNRGEQIALVGPSGGGKSTISSLICRFYEPDCGEIFVNGTDLNTLDESYWRGHLGLVLQDVFLFPGTVMDNLKVFDDALKDEMIFDAAKTLGAHETMCSLSDGYHTVLSERGANLSLGQRQLIGFIRAMIKKPQLLILDEATASMDPYTEHILQEAMEKLIYGRTALIVAHRLSTIKNAHKILYIENGKIAESGSHDELLSSSVKYRKLYQVQTESAA